MSNDPNKPAGDPQRPTRAPSPASGPKQVANARPPSASRSSAAPNTAKPDATANRPARPQAPSRPATGQRLEGVLYESQEQRVQSIDSIAPSGLSTSTYLPSARRNPEKDKQLRLNRQLGLRQTVLPSTLMLAASTMLLAGAWFLLDPTSALRDNSMGNAIPLTLAALAVCFGTLAALLIAQSASLRKKIADVSKALGDAPAV